MNFLKKIWNKFFGNKSDAFGFDVLPSRIVPIVTEFINGGNPSIFWYQYSKLQMDKVSLQELTVEKITLTTLLEKQDSLFLTELTKTITDAFPVDEVVLGQHPLETVHVHVLTLTKFINMITENSELLRGMRFMELLIEYHKNLTEHSPLFVYKTKKDFEAYRTTRTKELLNLPQLMLDYFDAKEPVTVKSFDELADGLIGQVLKNKLSFLGMIDNLRSLRCDEEFIDDVLQFLTNHSKELKSGIAKIRKELFTSEGEDNDTIQ